MIESCPQCGARPGEGYHDDSDRPTSPEWATNRGENPDSWFGCQLAVLARVQDRARKQQGWRA